MPRPRRSRRDRDEDRRHGILDGHSRLPSLTDIAPYGEPVRVDRLFAPYPEALAHQARSEMEREFLEYHARTAAARDERGRLDAEIAAQEETVRRNRVRVEEAHRPLTPAELAPRNPAETSRDEEWLRRRREVMRERRIARAEGILARSLSTLDDLRARRAQVCEALDREFDAARTRARRVGEFMGSRVAAYWQGVAATHPDGKHLATLVEAMAPELPDWAAARSECGRLVPAGDAAESDVAESDVDFEASEVIA